ncbi:MAG: hypothetical protein ABF334_10780 [Akkermansiaceae bacterium]
MKNKNSDFTTFLSFSEGLETSPSSYKRVNSLTHRMAESFESEPALKVHACDEIPDHALTSCLERCRDIIGTSQLGERERGLVQDCIRENLHGLTELKKEYLEAETEYQRLNAKAEPFFEKMAPLLDQEEAGISGFEASRINSLKETLAECVQAVTFAKYRRDSLRERMVAVITYVGDEVVESVRARNLANPNLETIEQQVKSALFE